MSESIQAATHCLDFEVKSPLVLCQKKFLSPTFPTKENKNILTNHALASNYDLHLSAEEKFVI